MASRTDWLSEVARPVAKDLAQRCGSLKQVVSAGVLLLYDCSPEVREYYFAKSCGAKTEHLENPEQEFRRKVEQIVREIQAADSKKQSSPRSRTSSAKVE